MFGNTTIGLLLFITHILSCLTVGFIFRFWKYNLTKNTSFYNNSLKYKEEKNVNLLNLGEVIGNSITNSISTILMIGGFIVLFSVIISILKASNLLTLLAVTISPILNTLCIPNSISAPLITGFLEITNGIDAISNIHLKNISINIIIVSFLLGFGGISVMLQVFSILAKTDLSVKPYVIGKLLHGLLAAIYTYTFIYVFPFFNFDL